MTRIPLPAGNLPAFPGLPVERLHGGEPILAPTAHWWENGVTFNTAAVYLPRSAANDPHIARLLGVEALSCPDVCEGVVAAHYRARPDCDPGFQWTRSFVGLAVFTPDTGRLLARWDTPVIAPSEVREDDDFLGVEDPRITRIGDDFYAVYCGVEDLPARGRWKANVCLAHSRDLLHWDKYGAIPGDLNAVNNKDGVLFPEQIDGHYLLLHRPMIGHISRWTMHLAMSERITGVWQNCGEVLRADQLPDCESNWVGAGSTPIPLGDRRYLVIFHTGHFLCDGRRQYDLDAAIFNFHRFDPARPWALVEARLNRMMVPETDCEINGPYHDSVANVLFTCGSYLYRDHLYLLYGGGDTFVMSARIPLAALLDVLETDCRLPCELAAV